MNQAYQRTTGNWRREQEWLNLWVLMILPILVLFPRTTGWISVPLMLCGIYIAAKYKAFLSIDRFFLAICLILPISILFNMPFMGWEIGELGRPSHLIAGFFIFVVIGRYGLRPNVLFWAACLAAMIAFGIALYEVVYLGNERVFGLARRWNAVPFGNFSLLIAFFCLAGVFVIPKDNRHSWWRIVIGLLGFLCGFGASLMSGTRGGWIALPILLLLCMYFSNRLTPRLRNIFIVAILVVIVGGGTISDRVSSRVELAINQVHAYVLHPKDLSVQDNAVAIRLAMWQWGIERFLEHPLTGIGFAEYEDRRKQAVRENELPKEFGRLANLHNELISRLAMGGLPAALAVLVFWFLGWRFFVTKIDNENSNDQSYYALCGLVTIVGTCLFSMTEALFGTSSGTKAIMLLLVIPAGALRYVYVNQQERKSL